MSFPEEEPQRNRFEGLSKEDQVQELAQRVHTIFSRVFLTGEYVAGIVDSAEGLFEKRSDNTTLSLANDFSTIADALKPLLLPAEASRTPSLNQRNQIVLIDTLDMLSAVLGRAQSSPKLMITLLAFVDKHMRFFRDPEIVGRTPFSQEEDSKRAHEGLRLIQRGLFDIANRADF